MPFFLTFPLFDIYGEAKVVKSHPTHRIDFSFTKPVKMGVELSGLFLTLWKGRYQVASRGGSSLLLID